MQLWPYKKKAKKYKNTLPTVLLEEKYLRTIAKK